jgi:uncharacterized membrane protein YbhN (UPF0104 family)
VAATARGDTESTPALRRLGRIVLWVGAIAAALALLDAIGIPVASWIHELFKDVREVPAWAIVGAVVLETLQTSFAALSWLTILRVAFPDEPVSFRTVLACYATAVALNGFLPANIGTLVMLVMLVTVIASATFAAILSGFVVQKIPFTVLSAASWIYLFATVSGSLSLELGFVSKHPGATVLIAVGGVVLIVLVCRILWQRATKLREQVKSGGAVLGHPRRFLTGVALPQVASFAARLGIVAVFLAAYSIPTTFHTVVTVATANSVSSTVSVTPGSAGVTQALNVVVLDHITTKQNATAYSVAQQLIVTAWDVLFGVIMICWVFGWSGGKALVRESYAAAEVKRDELKEQRAAKRAARPHRRRREPG